jgi:hypothetical protein
MAPKPKGKVNLEKDTSDESVRKSLVLWEKVGDALRSGEMPPADAKKKPTAAEMDLINRWLDAVVYRVSCDGPLDPGELAGQILLTNLRGFSHSGLHRP